MIAKYILKRCRYYMYNCFDNFHLDAMKYVIRSIHIMNFIKNLNLAGTIYEK